MSNEKKKRVMDVLKSWTSGLSKKIEASNEAKVKDPRHWFEWKQWAGEFKMTLTRDRLNTITEAIDMCDESEVAGEIVNLEQWALENLVNAAINSNDPKMEHLADMIEYLRTLKSL